MAVDLLLPDELIVEILSMLPAKSLLRCRLVCKCWLNLISSSKFKLMHLHNFNQLNPRYFVRRLDYQGKEDLFRVHFDNEALTLDRGIHVEVPFIISHAYNNLRCRIIGCCNGVVCLCSADGRGSSFRPDRVILWNPSIRRNLALPNPIFKSIMSVVLGLGYDKMSDDFKLVHLIYTDYGFTRPHVEVYTVKTDIWREVMFPDDLRNLYVGYHWTQTFFDGCVHWIASDRTPGVSRNSIMTFDLSTELFGEIMLPDDLVKVELSTIMVSLVSESLAVTYCKRETMASSSYKIWVMKEYNNPASWTLMYNMNYPDIDMGTPLRLRNNGDMIMEAWDGNIVAYNYSQHASCICPGYAYGCMT